mmetsp:Transcript_1243/g.3704  ORF Transcript_1243/g.3704 Transcript_1243/m.3704 type:complete len:212 (-) Transcript_1243:1978-2613(-)
MTATMCGCARRMQACATANHICGLQATFSVWWGGWMAAALGSWWSPMQRHAPSPRDLVSLCTVSSSLRRTFGQDTRGQLRTRCRRSCGKHGCCPPLKRSSGTSRKIGPPWTLTMAGATSMPLRTTMRTSTDTSMAMSMDTSTDTVTRRNTNTTTTPGTNRMRRGRSLPLLAWDRSQLRRRTTALGRHLRQAATGDEALWITATTCMKGGWR